MASTYLTRTNGSTSSTLTKGTFSAWVKKSNPSTEQTLFTGNNSANTYRDFVRFEANSQLRVREAQGSFNLETSAVYRDVNGWYHIVAEIDTTLATSTDRVKVYVNGERVTSFSSPTYPSQNHTLTGWSNNTLQTVGRDGKDNNTPFDGSMAHVHWIDGTAYDASAFGETDTATGIWKPKTAPVVTYGTNGFFLKFENSASFGTDSSPNGNNFTVNGTMTQTIDTPSNVFATLNPLSSVNYPTFSNGNTKTVISTSDANGAIARGTQFVSQGKYYWEVKLIGYSSLSRVEIGVETADSVANNIAAAGLFGTGKSRGRRGDANTIRDGNATASYGSALTTNNIVGVALDLDNGAIYFSTNGVWENSGDPESGASKTGAAFTDLANDTWSIALGQANNTFEVNTGNGFFGTTAVSSVENPDDGIGIFEHEVPAGYKALCTKSINATEYN
jgi:hypothetical protein